MARSFAPKDGDWPYFAVPGAELGDGEFRRQENTPCKAQRQAVWGKVPMPVSCLHKARQGDRDRQERKQEEDSHTVKPSVGTEVAALASPSPVFPVRCMA